MKGEIEISRKKQAKDMNKINGSKYPGRRIFEMEELFEFAAQRFEYPG
jgi:hypothetical protein